MGDMDAHINPAFTVASVLMTGHPEPAVNVHPCADSGRIARRRVGVAFLSAALEAHSKPRKKARLLLNRSCNPAPGLQLLE